MNKDQIDELCRRLVDGGKLLEAGWLWYRLQVLPPDCYASIAASLRPMLACDV